MYLKSVQGLYEAVQQTSYYKTRRESIKPVIIDKCNFLLNSIVEGNRHTWNVKEYTPVPLHRDILRSQLGNPGYKEIITLLQDLNYINIDDSYLSTPYINILNNKRKQAGLDPKPLKAESKKYGLTSYAKELGIIKVGVISDRMEKKLEKYKSNLIDTYLKDKQIHSKIIFNTTELFFDADKGKTILDNVSTSYSNTPKETHYKETYSALCEINGYNSISNYSCSPHYYYTQSKLVNRVFHYFANVPKDFRECLTLRTGETLTEIDLKNSQPLIIALNYINGLSIPHNISKNRNKVKEREIGKGGICGIETTLSYSDKMLLEDVLSGNFYKRVADYGKQLGNKGFYDLYTNDYSKFKATVLGEGLYFNLLPIPEIKTAEKYLLDIYPDFMKYIRKRKAGSGYKSISIDAQLIESRMFITNLFIGLEHGREFAVPIHDSIIVKSAETNYYLSKLIDIFRTEFPFIEADQVKDLFRITNY